MKITADPEEFAASWFATDGFNSTFPGRSSGETIIPASGRPVGVAMTVDEAARYIHPTLTKSAIYKLINDGKLKAEKIGGRWMTTEDAVKEFLRCHDGSNPQGFGRDEMKTYGSSSTEVSKSGRDAALASVSRLKTLSAST